MRSFEDIKVVNIETVSGCNLRCEWCSLAITRKKLRFMEPAVLDRVLDQFRGMDVLIAPYLGGEPLLHPDFSSVVRQVRAAGFRRVRIHTNGTRMSPALARDLVAAGLTEIVFSVDGRDAADFERLRGTSFAGVKENLRMFLDAAGGRTQVGVQCMVSAGGPKELNVDLLDLRGRFSFEIVEYPHNWVWPELVSADTVAPFGAQTPCFFLQHYMTFDWQGRVLPCCRCLNSERVLGDASEGARAVWAGALEEMRQQHTRGEQVAPCSSCDWYAPNAKRSLEVIS